GASVWCRSFVHLNEPEASEGPRPSLTLPARKIPNMPRDPLPIDAALPQLLAALRASGAVVLRAPTGAGKTTRVPPALVESGLAGAGLVLVLEPRRVAARAAARRMAIEDDTPLGARFGDQVRFDKNTGHQTQA